MMNIRWMIFLGAFLWTSVDAMAETFSEAPQPVKSTKLQALTPEVFDSKIAANEKFTVFMVVAVCENTVAQVKFLEKYVTENNLQDQMYYFGVADEADIPLAMRVIPRIKNGMAPPQFIAFEDGRFVDWSVAFTEDFDAVVENYFVRNRYTKGKSTHVKDYSKEKLSAQELQKKLEQGSSLSNLSGLNLEGVDLSMLTFSGSALKKTNLKGANLEGASFAYADMTGANLAGANVKDVNWHHTICPDGTQSEKNANKSCEGHLGLKARAVEKAEKAME